MTREIAHQKSFEKALYAIEPNFPPGKQPGDPRFTNVYFNMSQGDGDMRGSWNQGDQWDFVSDRDKQAAVDGGDGTAQVTLPSTDVDVLKQMAARTMSDPSAEPLTGAELGKGVQDPGAGHPAAGSMGAANKGN
jgi:Mn-containing catalase